MTKSMCVVAALGAVIVGCVLAVTGGSPTAAVAVTADDASSVVSTTPGGELTRVVDIGEGRTLYRSAW